MTYASKKIHKLALCILLLLNSAHVNAQISVIQNLIDKMESYKNFSYQSTNKRRDMSVDTAVALNKELFLKAPNDKQFGYYYTIETDYKTEKFHKIDLYNGAGLTILLPEDSIFFSEDERKSAYNQSLIGTLKSLKDDYNNKPFKITILKDTVINGIANSHFMANTYDTIENNEHLYVNKDYYIDKQTGLPGLVTIKAKSKYRGLLNNYYDETKYFDYKTNQSDVTIGHFVMPKGFKPHKDEAKPTLLTVGTIAPEWTLYDTKGNKLSLGQLKGKVVLLDFYFIGCSGCMASIIPLNAVYKKYKNKDLIIASLTERDSKKAVLDFDKRYKINYTGYINVAEVVKSYHVANFPTFYFIDKEGKIGRVLEGYDDDFEQKVTATIDKLLSK